MDNMTGRERERREVPDISGMVLERHIKGSLVSGPTAAVHHGRRLSLDLAWRASSSGSILDCLSRYHRPSPNYGINAQTGRLKRASVSESLKHGQEHRTGSWLRYRTLGGWHSQEPGHAWLPYLDATLGQGSTGTWQWPTPSPLQQIDSSQDAAGVFEPWSSSSTSLEQALPQFFRPQVPAVHDLSVSGEDAKKQSECWRCRYLHPNIDKSLKGRWYREALSQTRQRESAQCTPRKLIMWLG